MSSIGNPIRRITAIPVEFSPGVKKEIVSPEIETIKEKEKTPVTA